MKVYAILDTLHSAESVNGKIQEMLDNMGLAAEYNSNANVLYNYEITNLFPNPFNPVLHINIDVAWSGITQVNILDISGSHIENLHNFP